MQYSEIKTQVRSLAEQDLSIQDADILAWVNQAINRINVDLNAAYKKLTGTDAEVPAFDERFHESLIVFANAKYRESDADFNSASYFIAQFNDMIRKMQREMVVPVQFSKDPSLQQIDVTNATTMVYSITTPPEDYYSTISIYLNGAILDPSTYTISYDGKTLTLLNVTLQVGDRVTVKSEESYNKPHVWWNF